MSPEPRIAAIVLAGGRGERFGREGGKQLAEVAGRSVLSWTLSALERSRLVDVIVVVCPAERRDEYRSRGIAPAGLSKPTLLADSGATRQDSVASGLAVLPPSVTVVAVHDGARPLVMPEDFDRCIDAVASAGADGAVLGHPAVDTLKVVSDGVVTATPDRSDYWYAQTPQVFGRRLLEEAHERARRDGYVGTDDSAIVERVGAAVVMVEGPRHNIKVTVADDLAYVAALLGKGEGVG